MPVNVLTKSDFAPRSIAELGKHFAKKAALTDAAFERLSQEARAHAFRVAGIHKARLISDIKSQIAKAIEEGTSWTDVQRDLLTRFDTEGVPRPALHRLRTMFLQNTMQSYNDGRREVLDEPTIADAFPYRMYLTVGDGTAGLNGVRPTHAALHGKVFRADDPFWDRFTPPWDWGCRCTFVPLTAGQARAHGAVIDLDYVERKLEVPGTTKKGIREKPGFARGTFDLSAIDAEIREALEGMIG